ncbi:MAG: Lar family restriction alleviation protein [Thermotogota bacterium]|nr:Lar family restriction alleviation protein [Thermotogota bacterium]
MKIKQCPFCARDPKIHIFHENTKLEDGTVVKPTYTIVCDCGAESPKDSSSRIGAIRIWNRRRLTDLTANQ